MPNKPRHPQALPAVRHFHTTTDPLTLHCWCGGWLLIDYFSVPNMRTALDRFLDQHDACKPKERKA